MRLPVLFVVLTVMIDAMGIGLMMPVMPDLLQEVGGGTLGEAAIWGGILATSFAVMQFLCGPLIGSLSDRFGRRPMLITSLAVMAADYVVMALAGSMWLLLAGRIVGGITAATQATASAYMADISPPEARAARFGLIGAGFGIGFVLGPLIGGLLAGYGTRAPFWAAALLAGGNALLGWFVLRETVTEATRRAFSWRRANPLGALRSLGRLPGVTPLLAVYFLYHFAFSAYPAIWAYFGQARFDWTPAVIGLSLGLFGAAMALVQGGLIRPFLTRLGERGTVIAGHLFNLVSFTLISVISLSHVVLMLVPIAALGGIIPPALQAMMSRRAAADAQGELQGALTSVAALATILSPMTMTYTFARFTDPQAPLFLPGAPFLLSALLTLTGLAVILRTPRAR